MDTTIDRRHFDARGFTRPGTWVVDFSATWCAPCRAMEPVMHALARELAGQVGVATIMCDDEPQIADRYGVLSFPTFIVFRDGQPIARRVGATSLARMRDWIASATLTVSAAPRA